MSWLTTILLIIVGIFIGASTNSKKEDERLTLSENAIVLGSSQWGIFHKILAQPEVKLTEWL